MGDAADDAQRRADDEQQQDGAGGIAVIDEIALAEQARKERKPIPAGNGLLAPARWEMFGRIANTVANTEFVPRDLRGKPAAVMACLLYGDALGLHPSVALTEVYIVDGRPTMSATLMVGKIRTAGHKLKREEIRADDGTFVGTKAIGVRDDGTEDDFTFTLEMAARAGLMSKHNWKSYPESMCWARCVSQLARMLFPDVFLGQSAYTSEELGVADTDDDGVPVEATGAPVPIQAVQEPQEDVAEPQTPGESAVAAAAQEVVEPAEAQEAPLEAEDAEIVEEGERGTEPEAAGDETSEGVGREDQAAAEAVEPPAREETNDEGPWTPLDDRAPTETEYHEAKLLLDDPETQLSDVELETLATLVSAFEAETADAGAGAAPAGAAEEVAKATIATIMPLVEAAVARGDHMFVGGVLNEEMKKPAPRQRLVDALTAKQAEARVRAGLPEKNEPFKVPDGVELALLPFEECDAADKVLWMRGALAFIETLDPNPAWKYDAVVLTAQRTWPSKYATISRLVDVEPEDIAKMWAAVPAAIKELLVKSNRAAVERAVEQAGIGE